MKYKKTRKSKKKKKIKIRGISTNCKSLGDFDDKCQTNESRENEREDSVFFIVLLSHLKFLHPLKTMELLKKKKIVHSHKKANYFVPRKFIIGCQVRLHWYKQRAVFQRIQRLRLKWNKKKCWRYRIKFKETNCKPFEKKGKRDLWDCAFLQKKKKFQQKSLKQCTRHFL